MRLEDTTNWELKGWEKNQSWPIFRDYKKRKSAKNKLKMPVHQMKFKPNISEIHIRYFTACMLTCSRNPIWYQSKYGILKYATVNNYRVCWVDGKLLSWTRNSLLSPNLKVYCCVHKRPLCTLIQCRFNPVHVFTPYLSNNHFNITLPSTFMSPKCSFSYHFPIKLFNTFVFAHACCKSSPSPRCNQL